MKHELKIAVLALACSLSGAVHAYIEIPYINPTTAVVGKPVTVKVTLDDSYSTACPHLEINYGDGVKEIFPLYYSGNYASFNPVHTYTAPGTYTVTVDKPASAPYCQALPGASAKGAMKVQVVSQSENNKMSPLLDVKSPESPPPNNKNLDGGFPGTFKQIGATNKVPRNDGSNVAEIYVSGPAGGKCDRAFVNWGDGSPRQQISGIYPIKASHTYTQGGEKAIQVTADQSTSCSGSAQGSFYAYPIPGFIRSFAGIPAVLAPKEIHTLQVKGAGVCEKAAIYDGELLSGHNRVDTMYFHPSNQFSWNITVYYMVPGIYTLKVSDPKCGTISTQVKVAAPPPIQQMNPMKPAILPLK